MCIRDRRGGLPGHRKQPVRRFAAVRGNRRGNLLAVFIRPRFRIVRVPIKTGFPKDKLRQTILFIKEHYGVMPFDCKQYERLYEFMKHNKIRFMMMIGLNLPKDSDNSFINK